MTFRQEIYEYQMAKFDKIIGSVELDESYFGASRIKGNKVKLKRICARRRYSHKWY